MPCRRWLDHVSSHELEIRIPGRSKYQMIVFTFQRSRATRGANRTGFSTLLPCRRLHQPWPPFPLP